MSIQVFVRFPYRAVFRAAPIPLVSTWEEVEQPGCTYVRVGNERCVVFYLCDWRLPCLLSCPAVPIPTAPMDCDGCGLCEGASGYPACAIIDHARALTYQQDSEQRPGLYAYSWWSSSARP